MLPGSASGRFRVIASDGFLTGEAVTAARFTLPNTAPQAAIFGPESGSAFDRGQTIVLLGTAMDLEEGALSGQNLRWRSSLEGDLGTGNELLLRRLQPGTHEITLTAQDRDAAISATAIRVVIRDVTGPALPDDEDEATIRRLLLGEAEEEDSNRIVVVAAAVAAALVALAFLIARRRRRSG